MCDRWLQYENFRQDMGERPEGKSLDRLNSFGNYEPNNCKWSTVLEQARNKRKRTTTFEQAEEVRRAYAKSKKPKAIAKMLGLTPGSVNGIVYLGQVSSPNDY